MPLTKSSGHLFDFVEPGMLRLRARSADSKPSSSRTSACSNAARSPSISPWRSAASSKSGSSSSSPMTVQFKSGSAEITLERQLIDQARSPAAIPTTCPTLDPTILVSPRRPTRTGRITTPTPTTCDARRRHAPRQRRAARRRAARRELQDRATPAVDAVEEITVSKASVDAENGHIARRHHQPEHEVGHERLSRLATSTSATRR